MFIKASSLDKMTLRLSSRMVGFAICLLILGLIPTIDAFVTPQVLRHPTISSSSSRIQQHEISFRSNNGSRSTALLLSADPKGENNLPMLLDPGTKGGALFLSLILFIVPIIGYQFCTNILGYDGIEAGRWIGVGFTLFTTVLWVGTYIVRVATKDMTYVS